MNKRLKLSLFLGVVATLSAGALTGVHLLTAGKIADNIAYKQMAGYRTILEIDHYDEVEVLTISNALSNGGVTKKQDFIVNNASVGIVYDATITGYSSGLSFQVGFKDDVYAGFNVVSSNETTTYGGLVLAQVQNNIKGKNAASALDLSVGVSVGATKTVDALEQALSLIAADYLEGRNE